MGRDVRPTAERFWEKVDKFGECWIWKAAVHSAGYGEFNLQDGSKKTIVLAHRLAWELTNGPIPPGMHVRHLVCDNKLCCRPDHLALGTHADNMADAARKRRMPRGANHWTHMRRERMAPKEHHGMHRLLTEDTVLAIRCVRTELGFSYKRIGAIFGLSGPAVRRIILGERWGYILDDDRDV